MSLAHRARRALALAAASLLALLAVLAASVAPAGAAAERPQITAPSAIAIEPATGTIVYQRNANQRRGIASTTKLMTALVTLEHASLDDVMTTVPYAGAPAESIAGFGAGEKVKVRDLLRALMITSANDAAMTLAVRVAGSEKRFVRLMNQRARKLGLKNTHYDNPIGLDGKRNYSSATDLVKLALVLRRDPFFRELVDKPSVRLASGARPRTFANRNTLVRTTPFVNGVKTGHTNSAGYLLVGSASRRGVTVLSAVMGEPSEAARDRDSLALLTYGLRRFKVATVVRKGQRLTDATLEFRGEQRTPLVASRTIRRTIRTGDRFEIGVERAPKVLDGPLPAGARVGTAAVVDRERGRIVERVAIVTGRAVDAASFMDRLRTWISSTTTMVLLAILVVCSVYLLRFAARRRRGDTGSVTQP